MANVDPSEITKFEKIAASWWDPAGEFKPLHAMNPLRLQYIQSFTQLSGKKILDVGCGGGILTESLAKQDAHVTGIDMSEESLAIARSHMKKNNLNIDYRHITVEEFAKTEPHTVDIITCMEMLEHVPDPASILQACATLLKPRGHLFISTINRNWKSYLLAIIGGEYLLGLLPKGTHDYAKLIRPSELEQWARQSDLQIKNLKGLTYNPLTNQFKLSDDMDVNYFAYFMK